jgi:YEATS domain-containing protein 4
MPEKQQSGNDAGDVNVVTQLHLPQHTTTSASITTTQHQQPQHYLSSQLNSRLDRTTVCLPIVHGSVAFYLGKRAENKNEYQSHQWTLYLRGLNNEDLSTCIEKVVFQLHPSFAQPIREYKNPPFEVTEKGWGEFEAQIRIHWKDPSEQMTMVSSQVYISIHRTSTLCNHQFSLNILLNVR